jgi:hypothetical protein
VFALQVSSWEGGMRGAEWRRHTGRVSDEYLCIEGKRLRVKVSINRDNVYRKFFLIGGNRGSITHYIVIE